MYPARAFSQIDEHADSTFSSGSPSNTKNNDEFPLSSTALPDARSVDTSNEATSPFTPRADENIAVPHDQFVGASFISAPGTNISSTAALSLPLPTTYHDGRLNQQGYSNNAKPSTDRPNRPARARLREVQAGLAGSKPQGSTTRPLNENPSLYGERRSGESQPSHNIYMSQTLSARGGPWGETQFVMKGYHDAAPVLIQTEASEILDRATAEQNVTTEKDESQRDNDSRSGHPPGLPANNKRNKTSQALMAKPKIVKTTYRPGRKYEMQWRIGQAPTALMRGAKEHENFERVLAATSRFYQGHADGRWKTAVTQPGVEADGTGLTESLAVSVMLVAGLITTGQKENANAALNKSLTIARQVLLSQHPQVCYWLIETSMDTSQTVAGRLRAALTRYLMSLSNSLLGEHHPLSILLNTPLTAEQRARLRMEAQNATHREIVKIFGTHAFSTMQHLWYWARVTASSGHADESIRMLEKLTHSWEQMYSANSAVALTALVEQARVMLAAGDDSVKVECMLGDALRRNDVLSSGQGLEPQFMDVAEIRLRGGLVYSRLAALRNLGRLHVKRWNFGAASYCLERSVEIAEAKLPPNSSLRQLCMSDLEAVRAMELEHVMGTLTIEDPTSRLPPSITVIPLPPMAES